jgi:hypothetical protein
MKNGLLSGMIIMKERRAKVGISIYEEKLANIREIQISNEVKHNEIKMKAMQLENMLPHLFTKAAAGEISPSQVEQARQELNKLKGLKGLKLEEPQYIERMSPARRILDLDKGKNGT